MIEQAPKFSKDQSVRVLTEIRMSGLLKSINDDYLYWDKVKYKSKMLKPEELWNAVKMERWLRSNKLMFGQNEFSFMITDYIQKSLHHFDLNLGGNLGSNASLSEADKTRFLISSIMEEAISSSQMEGAVTTRKKAKEMLQKELKPKNKSDYMILNNYRTIQHIIQHKHEDLTIENLLYIHSLISSNTMDKVEEQGVFRSNNDIYVVNHLTSEVVHQPPSFDTLPKLLNSVCDFFNEDTDENFIHPIIKGIIIHFMIAWIHPFSDGNGRTARALFYWYMLKKGYWLMEYLSISRIIKDTKSQYEKAYIYAENDDNDITYFINYNIRTMEKAFYALKEYISRKQKEIIQAAQFLKIPNINERQAQIIKLIKEDSDRVLTSKEIENRFQISNFTARSDLKGLVELELLQVIQVNKIKQNFIKSSKFENILSKYNIIK